MLALLFDKKSKNYARFVKIMLRLCASSWWREWKCNDVEVFVSAQGPVSRKSRKLFGPEKPFVKLRPANSVKPFFSYFVKGIKIKMNAKFRASRCLRFENTKENYVTRDARTRNGPQVRLFSDRCCKSV